MEAEKLNRDLDNLTPLDARNSLLMDPSRPMNTAYDHDPKHPLVKQGSSDSFMNEPANPYANATPLRPYTPQHRVMDSTDSRENLVAGAAPLGGTAGSPPRHPALPNVGYGNNGYRGMAY
jgi:hypothetical protein